MAWERTRTVIAAVTLTVVLGSVGSKLANAEGSSLTPPLIFSSDFEFSALEHGKGWNLSGNPPTITREVAREGKQAMKTVLNRKTSKVSYRTEVSANGHVTIKPGEEYWYGFSVYLPPSYVPDSIWEIVAQWHGSPDEDLGEADANLNPPLSLHTKGGEWMISTIWDSRPVTNKANYEGTKNYYLGRYETGKWTDWVFHVKWSPKSDGLLQVWKDGVLVVDKKGPIGFNDKVGPYFKMGLYKGWHDRNEPAGEVTERVLYHDAVRIAGKGGSYEAVAPGGGKLAAVRPKAPQNVVVR